MGSKLDALGRGVLVIDRDMWSRGEGGGQLLDDDGKMCVMGFYGRALGLSEDDMLYNGTLASCLNRELMGGTMRKRHLVPEWALGDAHCDNKSCPHILHKLLRANDGERIGEGEREKRIAKLLESVGVRVTFVGGEGESGDSAE